MCLYLLGGLRLDPAVVLVAPDDQVEEGGQEAFWDVAGGAALGAILVKDQQVEPAVSILLRPLELNLQNSNITFSLLLAKEREINNFLSVIQNMWL